MELSDFCSNYDNEMTSVDSDYSSGGSGHSSPCPASTTQVPKQPTAVLYYLIVPPDYHLEFTRVEHFLDGPAPVALPTEKPAEEYRSTENSTYHRRLIKWSLPPPPVRPANLPGWSPTP